MKCDYCESGEPLVMGKVKGANSKECGIYILYPNTLAVHGTNATGLVTKVNFCPICGKDLTGSVFGSTHKPTKISEAKKGDADIVLEWVRRIRMELLRPKKSGPKEK